MSVDNIVDEQQKSNGKWTDKDQSVLDNLVNPDARKEIRFNFDGSYERQLLGHILTDLEFSLYASELIKPGNFTEAKHRAICSVAFDYLREYQQLPSKPTIYQYLRKRHKNEVEHTLLTSEVDCIIRFFLDANSKDESLRRMAGFARWNATINFFEKTFSSAPENYVGDELWNKADENWQQIMNISPGTDAGPMGLKELISEADRDFKWYVEDWMPMGTLKILSGAGKYGKTTFLVGGLGDAFYTGQFMGLDAEPGLPTLWLDFDSNPLWHDGQMFKDALAGYDVEAMHSKFNFYSKAIPKGEPGNLPAYLTTRWLNKKLADCEENWGAKGVVIIDSLRPAFIQTPNLESGWDVDPTAVGRLVRPYVDVSRETGWALIFIHHDNRAGTFQGSAELQCACDSMDHFTKFNEKDFRELETFGRRVSHTRRVLQFRDGKYYPSSSAEHKEQKTAENKNLAANRIIEVLKEHPGLTSKDGICEFVDAPRNIVRSILDRYENAGVIEKVNTCFALAEDYEEKQKLLFATE